MKKFIVGITGGICSGKSAVSDIISSLGGYIIDADIVSRLVMNKQSTIDLLYKNFPTAFINGVLDRKKLRKIVFNNKTQLSILNNITHPLIKQEILNQIDESNEKIIFLVIPLLFETGYDKYCDYIVSICVDNDIKLKRLTLRDNIDENLAQKIINNQTSDELRQEKSNEVFYNNTSLTDLKNFTVDFYHRIKEKILLIK